MIFINGAIMTFTITETGGVATIDVTDGADINSAFIALRDYVDTTATATSGVVNVTASTSFSSRIIAQDNVSLNIEDISIADLDASDFNF